jgi:hypothetical protein
MTYLRTLRTGVLGATVATALVLPATGATAAGPGANETCAEDQQVLFDGEDNGHVQGHELAVGATFTDGEATVTITDVVRDEDGEVVEFTYTVDGTTVETVLVKAGRGTTSQTGTTITSQKAISHVIFCAELPEDGDEDSDDGDESSDDEDDDGSGDGNAGSDEGDDDADEDSDDADKGSDDGDEGDDADEQPGDETDVAGDEVTRDDGPSDGEDASDGDASDDDQADVAGDQSDVAEDETGDAGIQVTAPTGDDGVSGAPTTPTATTTAAAPATEVDRLAATGLDADELAWLAAVTLLGGAGVLVASRRRVEAR